MSIFAIDPGPVESAWVDWDGGKVVSHGKAKNAHVRNLCLAIGQDGWVVIEKIASYGMAVGAEVFETCVWTGRFIEACGQDNRITRCAVKSHLCHSAKAKDANVRQALIDRLGPPAVKEPYTPTGKTGKALTPRERTVPGPTAGLAGDEWAALAVAVTWHDLHKAVR